MAILTVNAMSQKLMRTVTFNVYLPSDNTDFTGKRISKPPYKTLYLLHGIFGDHNDWFINTTVAYLARKYHLAVVTPAGENRFYLDNEASATLFGEFIGEELLQLTREMFPLSHKREDTFIAGLSMGGYGALRNGLKYAKNFGAVGAFSGALIVDHAVDATNDSPVPFQRRAFYEAMFGDLSTLLESDRNIRYLLETVPATLMPQLYISCGTEDFLISSNHQLRDELTANKVAHTYEEWAGGHDWQFWQESIERFLAWLPLSLGDAGVSSGNVMKR